MSHETLAGLLPWLLAPSLLAVLVVIGGAAQASLTRRSCSSPPVPVPAGWTRTVSRTRGRGVVVRLHRRPAPAPPVARQPVVAVTR